MPSLQPIYTPDNCKIAYQLDWSLAVFWRTPPDGDDWLAPLKVSTESDGIRILKHRFDRPDLSLFLVSSQPHVCPKRIPSSVKGRLQHLLRRTLPKPFQRNYDLRSIGSTKREKLEHYLAGQMDHHPMADERVQQRLAQFQIHRAEIDLSRPRFSAHGRFWCNLHLVFVNDGRWCEIRPDILGGLQRVILRSSVSKGHLLSRAALVPDHIHMILGSGLEESPRDVALSYLNNLASVWGMRPVYQFSCFVGTAGEYDLGAIR